MKPVGVILAAGLSSRMGRPKALLPYRRTTFLGSLIEAFTASLDRTIVVLGCSAEAIAPTIPIGPRIESAYNAEYELGMLSSLQTALALIPRGSPVAFTLVDHPGLRPETLGTLCDVFEESHAAVVIPRFQGERGHPVIVAANVVDELRALPPDASPKQVIRAHRPDTAFLDVDDPAVTLDIDRPEDLAKLD